MTRFTKLATLSIVAIVCASFLNVRLANAGLVAGPVLIVNEYGTGTFDFGIVPIPVPFTIGTDPGPGGATNALTYTLPWLGQPGDVLLVDPDDQVSDVLRFNGNGTLIFYSDLPEPGEDPNLADIGFPSALQANTAFFSEIDFGGGTNGLFYAPFPGQPGYDGSNPIYVFYSDIPEPGTVTLAGLSVLGLLAFVRRKK